jgi:hypothetical protein
MLVFIILFIISAIIKLLLNKKIFKLGIETKWFFHHGIIGFYKLFEIRLIILFFYTIKLLI